MLNEKEDIFKCELVRHVVELPSTSEGATLSVAVSP